MTEQNKRPQRGLFFTIEGIEGVGKSTNIAFIKAWFEAQQLPLYTTREPGGTPYAEQIRQLLITPVDETVSDDAELLLVFAARAQHIAQAIAPQLESGTHVLSDRFTDATYAYQGGGRGLDYNKIITLEQLVQGDLRPDAVFILDVPVAVSQQRMAKREAQTDVAKDRFEQEQAAFFERVRHAYLERAAQAPERYFVIDATQPLDAVQRDIASVLESLVGKTAGQV